MKTNNLNRLFTEMGALSTFIDLVKSVVVLVDSTVGQYTAIYSICKIDGGYFLKNFFSCDIPISLAEYLTIRKFSYWFGITRHILRKSFLCKIDNSLVHSYFIKNNVYSNATFVNLINLNFNQDICPISSKTTSSLFESFPRNSLTANYIKSEYVLYRFSTNCVELINNNSSISWLESKILAKFNRLWHYAVTPVSLNIAYDFWFINKISASIQIITQKHIFSIIGIVTTFLFFIYFALFFFNFFVRLVRTLSGSVFLMQKLTKEQDQEVTSFEDLLIFIVFFCTFFINSLNLYTNTALIQYNLNVTFWMLFIYFFSLIVIVPTSIVLKTGSNCFMYIKGSDKYNSMVAYITFDIITLLAFFLRFFLQIIRWCLFLTTYYLLHEFVFEWVYGLFINLYNSNSVVSSVFMWVNSNAVLQLLMHIIRFTFELLDTCLILTIQITAFIAVILWLFNYLFSLSLDDLYESLFENKINIKC